MYTPTKWKDEILDSTLSTEAAAGTGAKTTFALAAAPLSVEKVTIGGARVYDWIYYRATHSVIFDTAPASGAAIAFSFFAEIQQGTNMSAARFNNQEEDGALDGHVAGAILGIALGQETDDRKAEITRVETELGGDIDDIEDQIDEEIQTVTITHNTPYPFIGNGYNVNLAAAKPNANYDVTADITAHTGPVGEIVITGKLVNGFNVNFDGSGQSVTLKLRIKGGTM